MVEHSLSTKKAILSALELVQGAAASGQTAAERALSKLYAWSDRRPWRLGYTQFRLQYLRNILHDEATLALFREARPLPAGHGVHLDARVVEIPWVLSRLPSNAKSVLDAGSSLNFLEVLSSPPLAERSLTLLTLVPERRCFWKLGVSYLFGDLRHLLFQDETFDAIACISTIEHVGMDNSLYAGDNAIGKRSNADEFLSAIRELKRVLKTNGRLFVTFPFGRYEDLGWFQQFDADLADRLIAGFAPRQLEETVYRYDPDGWKLSCRSECAQCRFFDVRRSKYFDPNSSLDFPPHFPAGEGAVMCLELTK